MAEKGLAKRISVSASSKNRMSLPSGSGITAGLGPTSASGTKLPIPKALAVNTGVPSPGSPGEVPLIPYIKTADNGKVLPKYTVALSSTTEDLIPAEDLDAIQLELELLMSTVALRYRVLKSEIETIDKADERRERKGKFIEKAPASPGKKKRLEEKQKLRESAGKLFGHHMKLSKMKNMSSLIPPSPAPSQNTDDSSDAVPFLPANHHIQHVITDNTKLLLPKNDTPNKFWMSVEPYCMPITHEDLKLLNDLLEEYSGPLIPPIPELGPHYSTQWAADDIKEEQDNSKKSKGLTNGDVAKKEKVIGEGITGPLTQRLVSALMEENLLPDCNSTSNENSNSSSDVGHGNSRSAVSLLKNGISIERRLRKELIDQGILDDDDMPKSQQDDEILSEINRVRTEIAVIAEYNSNEIRKLQSMAQDEMKRIEVKRKLDRVDQEIIECYKKIMAARLKRRPLTKPERDEAYRLAEEQKRLSDQLELMPVHGPFGSN
ncbi:transcriptional adapter 3 [Toxorhynchites rutilus septentrionalis]|uniref:transcriptional adapter 3 n=1 Tax=Toxorhynchites rutilus septentrionalis TaxID=329112 RepID=UPI002478C9FE|nr:transcriptional adapter 3 [Toxorhynchites rutilus septentrionalis]